MVVRHIPILLSYLINNVLIFFNKSTSNNLYTNYLSIIIKNTDIILLYILIVSFVFLYKLIKIFKCKWFKLSTYFFYITYLFSLFIYGLNGVKEEAYNESTVITQITRISLEMYYIFIIILLWAIIKSISYIRKDNTISIVIITMTIFLNITIPILFVYYDMVIPIYIIIIYFPLVALLNITSAIVALFMKTDDVQKGQELSIS